MASRLGRQAGRQARLAGWLCEGAQGWINDVEFLPLDSVLHFLLSLSYMFLYYTTYGHAGQVKCIASVVVH